MGDDPAAAQLLEEVLGTFERFHFDINAADLSQCMSVRTGAGRNSQAAPQLPGPPVYVRLRASVEDLHDVDLVSDPLNSHLPQVAPARVVRVFEVDEPTLPFDRCDGFLGRQPLRDGFLEKETDQFAFGGKDLLANHDSLPGFPERVGSGDRVVVGENDRGEAELSAAPANLKGRHPAVKGGRAMEVEINPDNGGACTYRHVGYYRRTEEGLGLISGVAVGW